MQLQPRHILWNINHEIHSARADFTVRCQILLCGVHSWLPHEFRLCRLHSSGWRIFSLFASETGPENKFIDPVSWCESTVDSPLHFNLVFKFRFYWTWIPFVYICRLTGKVCIFVESNTLITMKPQIELIWKYWKVVFRINMWCWTLHHNSAEESTQRLLCMDLEPPTNTKSSIM